MTSKIKNIGILGGTFDPPHLGHLAVAQAAIDNAALDRVLLVPTRIPPHKMRHDISPVNHRLQMTRLLALENRQLSVCEIELSRAGRSYTIDTLIALRDLMPDAAFRLLLGEDMASEFHTWRQSEKLMQYAPPMVAARPGSRFPAGHMRGMPDSMRQKLEESRMNIAPVDISSTAIRAAVAAGRPVSHLLTARVYDYIMKHGLYR